MKNSVGQHQSICPLCFNNPKKLYVASRNLTLDSSPLNSTRKKILIRNLQISYSLPHSYDPLLEPDLLELRASVGDFLRATHSKSGDTSNLFYGLLVNAIDALSCMGNHHFKYHE